ncbi:DgyrCDS12488 [Dimorphilus gyrociliatus]|uniref:RecQ-mediated genome instability protein 1 n=1 Tax=Dimorphilus gyrociliatus TaxID=2664684 RepID=A0A7I8W7I0_9ANNE|nr:DgyrCDS12488 [Dimorphilus gyrociliatus]
MQQKTIEAGKFLNKTYCIRPPEDWLEACVNWMINEEFSVAILNDSLSQNDINTNVMEQWLSCDLNEIGSCCFPGNLENIKQSSKSFLKGTFPVQANSMIDCSKPFYNQTLKLKNMNFENAKVGAFENEKEQSNKRMLKLLLTDGQQSIMAMEYNSIPAFDQSLSPGFKMLLKGDILCRNGVLFLTAENVTVLGGESEVVMEKNLVEIITEKLNGNITLRQDRKAQSKKKELSGKFLNKNPKGFRKTESTEFKPSMSNNQTRNFKNTITPSSNLKRFSTEDWSDDEIFQSIETDPQPLTDSENKIRTEKSANTKTFFDMEDDDDFEKSLREFDESFETCPSPKRQKLSQPKQANNSKDVKTTSPQEKVARISDYDDIEELTAMVQSENDIKSSRSCFSDQRGFRKASELRFGNDRGTKLATSPTKKFSNNNSKGPHLSSEQNLELISLSTLGKMKLSNAMPDIVYVRGYISRMLGKLKLTKYGWSVPANLTDEENKENLEILFSDKLLTSIIGIPASEVQKKKFEPNFKEYIQQVIKEGSSKLAGLKGVLKIQIDSKFPKPVLVEKISD